MLLTSNITNAADILTNGAEEALDHQALVDSIKNYAVTTPMLTGIFVCFGITFLTFVLACLFAYKFRGNAGGAFFAFFLGFVAAVICGSGGEALAQLCQVGKLLESGSTAKSIIGWILVGLCAAAVDFGFRYYLLYYMDKTGIGKNKAISVGCGYAAGIVGLPAFQSLSTGIAAISINKGTFFTEEMLQSNGLQNYADSVENLIKTPAAYYYTYALQLLAFCALSVALTIYFTRGWLEEKKLKSSLITAGITVGFEVVYYIVNGLSSKESPVISQNTAFTVSSVFCVLFILAMAFFTWKTLQNYPHGREKFVKSAAQRQADVEERKKRSTWAQVNAINARNIVPATDESETETNESEAETDATDDEKSAEDGNNSEKTDEE